MEFTMYETTNFYYRFPSELENRLDFVYYHPLLDTLEELDSSSKYSVVPILSIIRSQEDIISGKTPRGIPYTEDGIPFLGGTNVRSNETDLTDPVRIPEIYHTTILAASQLAKNDVLITIAGVGIGTCSVYESDDQANINQAIARLRFDNSDINPQFLSRYFNSRFGQLGFTKYSHWVLQPNINLEEIKLLKIIKPSYNEQNEILELVKPYETEYKTLKHKASVLQNDAFNHLLKELGFEKLDSYNYFFKTGAEKQSISFIVEPSEIKDRIHYLYYHPKYELLEKLKLNFKTVTLESIVTRQITRGEQPIYDDNGDNIVIKTIDIKDHYIDYDNALKVDNDFFNKEKIVKLVKGDILLASTGYVSMGKVNVYDREETAIADGHISIIRINENYDPYFIAYYLRSYLGQIQIEKYFTGSSGQIELQQGDINKFIIPSHESIPKNKQKEIAQKIRNKIEKALGLEHLANEKLSDSKSLFERLILKQNVE